MQTQKISTDGFTLFLQLWRCYDYISLTLIHIFTTINYQLYDLIKSIPVDKGMRNQYSVTAPCRQQCLIRGYMVSWFCLMQNMHLTQLYYILLQLYVTVLGCLEKCQFVFWSFWQAWNQADLTNSRPRRDVLGLQIPTD